jgi:ABC-type branched-subunit amino acid transport system substrate-binding protein
MAHKKYEITLYSVAKIRSTPNLDIEDLHRLNLHVSSSYTINYDDRRTKDFIYEYRALYDAEPNSFAYMGYDTAYSILSMISRYGNGWNKEIVGKKFEGLQSDFIFEHDGFDTGLENHAIRRTVYNPDFTVTLLR